MTRYQAYTSRQYTQCGIAARTTRCGNSMGACGGVTLYRSDAVTGRVVGVTGRVVRDLAAWYGTWPCGTGPGYVVRDLAMWYGSAHVVRLGPCGMARP